MVVPSLNDAPCGFATINDESLIVHVNSAFLEMVGVSAPADILGKRLEEYLSVASQIFYQTHFFPLLKLHGSVSEIFMTLRNPGEAVPVIVNAARRKRDDQWLNDCVFTIVRERQKYESEIIAARRTAEEVLRSNADLIRTQNDLERRTRELDRQVVLLEQKNRELRRISQILFHDLREPLRKLLSFTELLGGEKSAGQSTDSQHLVARIQSAATRMERLLRVVREYLAVESISTETLESVNLNHVIAHAARRAGEASRCVLKYDAEPLPTVEGDERQLELLFFHLFDNTIKFQRRETTPHVVVHATIIQQNLFATMPEQYRYVDFVKITFTDNSQGFDVNDADTPFQLLSKASISTSGLGTGLAVCRKVAENHFGSITVRSSRGHGVEYSISLPVRHKGVGDGPSSSTEVAASPSA